jgi:hypothetical protein
MQGWAAPESRTTPLTIHTSQLYTPAVEEEHTWCVPRQSMRSSVLPHTAMCKGCAATTRKHHCPLPTAHCPLPLPPAKRAGRRAEPTCLTAILRRYLNVVERVIVSSQILLRTSHCFVLDPATAVVRGRQRCAAGREVMHRQGGGSLTLSQQYALDLTYSVRSGAMQCMRACARLSVSAALRGGIGGGHLYIAGTLVYCERSSVAHSTSVRP